MGLPLAPKGCQAMQLLMSHFPKIHPGQGNPAETTSLCCLPRCGCTDLQVTPSKLTGKCPAQAREDAVPQCHSQARLCWHMLIHKLGRAKKAKEASMVLETKMPWSSLQLLQRPASTCPHFPPLFQVFTGWLHFHHKKKKKMPQLGKDRSGWGKRFARRPHLLP